jgi:hypothetical protein
MTDALGAHASAPEHHWPSLLDHPPQPIHGHCGREMGGWRTLSKLNLYNMGCRTLPLQGRVRFEISSVPFLEIFNASCHHFPNCHYPVHGALSSKQASIFENGRTTFCGVDSLLNR